MDTQDIVKEDVVKAKEEVTEVTNESEEVKGGVEKEEVEKESDKEVEKEVEKSEKEAEKKVEEKHRFFPLLFSLLIISHH